MFIFVAILLAQPFTVASPAPAAPPQKILKGRVDFLANMLHGAGLVIESKTLPALITEVRKGSSAFYGGVSEGDKLLSCKPVDDKLSITISRNGKIYGLQIATSGTAGSVVSLDKRNPVQVKDSTTDKRLAAAISAGNYTAREVAELKQSDFAILIDCSGSMRTAVKSEGPSRLRWCQDHIVEFAKQAMAIAGKKISVFPFADHFTEHDDCEPDEIGRLMAFQQASGGNDVTGPLEKVLTDHEALFGSQRKPLIVAIITDGLLEDNGALERLIISGANKLKTNDVKLVFFLIGADVEAARIVGHLDSDLEKKGARYDIVQVCPFDRLEKSGLGKALLK